MMTLVVLECDAAATGTPLVPEWELLWSESRRHGVYGTLLPYADDEPPAVSRASPRGNGVATIPQNGQPGRCAKGLAPKDAMEVTDDALRGQS